MLLFLLLVGAEFLRAQSLQVTLSSSQKVNRTTSGGVATIFFDSSIVEQIVGIGISDKTRLVVWDKENEKQLYSIPYDLLIKDSMLIEDDLYILGFYDMALHKLKLEGFPDIYRSVKDIVGKRVLTPEEKAKFNLE